MAVTPPGDAAAGTRERAAGRTRVRIRRYVDADRDLLHTLVHELHETVEEHDPYVRRAATMLPAYLEYLLATAADSDGRIWIAEDGRAAVGYLCLFGQIVAEEPDEQTAAYAFVADLYVRAGARGRGIGRALLARGEAHARRLGANRIELRVFAGNRDARVFYQSVGYRDRIVTMVKDLAR